MADKISFDDLLDLSNSTQIKNAISLVRELDDVYENASKTIVSESTKVEKSIGGLVSKLNDTRNTLVNFNEQTETGGSQLNSYSKEINKAAKEINGFRTASDNLKGVQDNLGKSVDGLKNKLRGQLQEFEKLRTTTNADEKALKTLSTQIRQTTTQITTLTRTGKALSTEFKNARGSYNDLVKQNQRLVAILKRLPPEFIKTNTRAKQLQQTIKSNTAQLKQFDAAIGRNFRNVGNYRTALGGLQGGFSTTLAALTGLTVGVLGAVQLFQGAVQANVELEEAQADVRKTTGLTREEVDKLTDSLKELNTRTSIGGLLEIAEIGGRLGVARDELEGFVTAVDLANVALGDTFGGDAEQVATVLARLNAQFKETRDLEVEFSLNAIGSALNELGANTRAFEPDIANFATRVGNLPEGLRPSAQGALALGAAITQVGVTSEEGARALGIFLTKAASNIDKFAAQLGISAKEAEELINTDVVKFTRDFAASLEGLNATQTAQVLKNLGLSAKGVQVTIGALAGDIEEVDRILKISNESFAEGTSLADEFAIKNDTLGASLDKLKNAFFNATTDGSAFAASIKFAVDQLTFLISGVSDARRELQEEADGFKAVPVAIIEAFKALNPEEQQKELEETIRITNKAKRELAELQIQRQESLERTGRTPGQDFNNQLLNQVDFVEALENQYRALKAAQSETGNETKELTTEIDDLTESLKKNGFSIQGIEKINLSFINTINRLKRKARELAEEIFFVDEAFDDLRQSSFNEEFIASTQLEFGISEDAEDDLEKALERINKLFKKNEKKRTDILAEEKRLRDALRQAEFDFAGELINGLFEIRFNASQAEFERLQLQRDAELQVAGDNEEAKARISEQFDKKELALRQKQARRDKAQGLFNVAINTAQAITRTIANLGFPAAIPFVALAAGTGLIQSAVIASQPIPQFAEGTTDSPAGPALVGEGGQPEYIVSPSNKVSKVSKPTIVNLERHSQVIPESKISDPASQKIFDSYSEDNLKKIATDPLRVEHQNALLQKEVIKELRAIRSTPSTSVSVNAPDSETIVKKGLRKTKLTTGKYG